MTQRYIPTIQQTIEGLTWFQDWQRGEDCGEPPPDRVSAWIDYAVDILENFKDHPDVKEQYE